MAKTQTEQSVAQALARARTQGPKVATSLVRETPQLAAIVSKLIKPDEQPRRDARGNRIDNLPDINAYRTVSEDTALAVSDAETIFDMLPDMKLCRQVLPSCILAPRDMVTMELSYDAPKDIASPEIVGMLINRLRDFFERDYKITEYLQKIVEDALFNRGSYPVVVIPENSIDELINRPMRPSMEAIEREFLRPDHGIISRGLLGPNDAGKQEQSKGRSRFSFEQFKPNTNITASQSDITLKKIFVMEEFDKQTGEVTKTEVNETGFDDLFLTVTDNADILKMPTLRDRVRERLTEQAVPGMYSAESYLQETHQMSDQQIESLIYKSGNHRMEPMVRLKPDDQLTRRSVGEPIILHLPSEAVIPIFVPGTPSKQIGFFILLDEQGHPLNTTDDPNYYQEMSSRLRTGGSFPSAMLQKVSAQVNGYDYSDRRHIARTVKVFGEMIEADLMQRLRNGPYGAGVEIASRDEIYRIMLSRTLQKQHTNILFVPAEMMTYFAFNYNRDGVGKSLMEGMKVLLSIRVQLMFANVMASMRNSIGRTKMKVKLDETDPQPMKTIETSVTEFVRTRQNYFPLGMSSPVDIADWLQRASVEVTYEGHPGLPDTGFEFEQYQSNIPKPDTELMEDMKKLSIMGVGLPPEQIDTGLQTEFATSLVQSSLLLTKRVIKDQETLEPLLMRHGRQVAKQYPRLVNDLRSILLKNVDRLTNYKKNEGKSESEIDQSQAAKNDKAEDAEFKAAMKERVEAQNNGEDVKPDDASSTGGSFDFGANNTPAEPDAGMGLDETESTAETESTGEDFAAPDAGDTGEATDKKEMPDKAIKTISAWGAIAASDTALKPNSQTSASDITNTIPKKVRDQYTHDQLVTVELVLNRFLSTFEMHLPRPNSATMANQGQSLQDYSDLLDKGIDSYISEKWFTTDMVGEEAKFVEAWKESMKSYFMRQFMADNGILPELGDIISTNDHGHAKLDMETMMLNHIKALVETLGKSQVKLKVVGAANDKILNAAGINPEGGAGGFGGGSFGGGGGFGDTGGFGAGGDEMGGFGADAGMGGDAAALGADAGAGAEGETPPEDPNAATF
jgi:hypothetical protein